MLVDIKTTPSGENNFIQKPDPDFLLMAYYLSVTILELLTNILFGCWKGAH
jgi:hypothetical protein